jgi:hypothetical protein
MRIALVLLALSGLVSPVYAQVAGGSFTYARLGYGAAFADEVRPSPAIGFGIRGGFDELEVDVSFLNYVIGNPYEEGRDVFAGSLFRLQVLRFLDAEAERSAYVGGGVSWGAVSLGRRVTGTTRSWNGTGLQGEVTAGYEFVRKSPMRLFVQTDIGLPFFIATSRTDMFGSSRGAERRYIPSAAVTFGIGFKRRRP